MRIKAAWISAIMLMFGGCSGTADAPEVLGYTVNGTDVHIIQSGTVLKDMEIRGDLYIDESIGDGQFHVEDCEILGSIYVHGAGPNSGHFINVIGREMVIASKTNPKIVLGMNTAVEGIQIASDCSLITDGGEVDQVRINSEETQNAVNVLMKGNYPDVSIESTANVLIDGEVSLMSILEKAGLTNIEMVDTSKVYFYSCYGKSVTVTGGTIVEAWINAESCSLPAETESVHSEVGVTSVRVGSAETAIVSTEKEVPPPEPSVPDAQKEPVTETDEDMPEETSEDDTPDQSESIVEASTPMLVESGTQKRVSVVVREPCTVYVMVETPEIFALGTTAEKVRDGISAGAGQSMGGGMYTVIHAAFRAEELNVESTFIVDMADYIPGAAGGGGEGVFVVLEDEHGNLSEVYSLL